jgi:hypothetical protein
MSLEIWSSVWTGNLFPTIPLDSRKSLKRKKGAYLWHLPGRAWLHLNETIWKLNVEAEGIPGWSWSCTEDNKKDGFTSRIRVRAMSPLGSLDEHICLELLLDRQDGDLVHCSTVQPVNKSGCMAELPGQTLIKEDHSTAQLIASHCARDRQSSHSNRVLSVYLTTADWLGQSGSSATRERSRLISGPDRMERDCW